MRVRVLRRKCVKPVSARICLAINRFTGKSLALLGSQHSSLPAVQSTMTARGVNIASGDESPWRVRALLLRKAFPSASREVIATIAADFCFQAHPVAKLVKPLQFRRKTTHWREGPTDDAEQNASHVLKVYGANLRECFLAGDAPSMSAPMCESAKEWLGVDMCLVLVVKEW